MEKFFVGQHRQGGGACLFEIAREFRGVEIGADQASRGRGLLQLGNHGDRASVPCHPAQLGAKSARRVPGGGGLQRVQDGIRRPPDMCADASPNLRWERRWRVAATIESREAGMADAQLYESRPIPVDPNRGRSLARLSDGCRRSCKAAHCSVMCAVDPPSGEML